MVERRHLAVLVFLQLTLGLLAQEYSMQVKTTAPAYSNNVPMVNRGESFTVVCNIMKNGVILEEELDVCQFELPSYPTRILVKPGRTLPNGMQYEGRSWNQGDCGLQLTAVQEKDNGNISCFVQSASTGAEVAGHTKLIFTIPPRKVTLAVWSPEDQRGAALLMANCTVPDARPRANISWFLNDDKITEGLLDEVEYKGADETITLQQNLTRTLQVEDDMKTLKCVAEHYGLKEPKEYSHTIHVNFAPKQAEKPFEKFELKEGDVVRIPITIEAQPKPIIYWTIDSTVISENDTKGRYRVESTQSKGPGKYETVLVIDTLTAADTDLRYIVTASNNFGRMDYTVNISSGPKPEPDVMTTELIVSVVMIIILILLVLGAVYYARAKGKFCFADRNSPRVAGESSDTESADHSTHLKPKNTFKAVFKKKTDKVAADKEMLRTEGSDGVVYAELELGPSVIVAPRLVDPEKTEYAEIIHTPAPAPGPPLTPPASTAPAPAPGRNKPAQ